MEVDFKPTKPPESSTLLHIPQTSILHCVCPLLSTVFVICLSGENRAGKGELRRAIKWKMQQQSAICWHVARVQLKCCQAADRVESRDETESEHQAGDIAHLERQKYAKKCLYICTSVGQGNETRRAEEMTP